MIEYDTGTLTIGGEDVQFARFPAYVHSHVARVPGTAHIEAMATNLSAAGFRESDAADFIRAVCKWGGYAGIAGRVFRDNPLTDLAASLRRAATDASEGLPVKTAIRPLVSISGFGVSFASKHLRFLAPRSCAILDSRMAAATGFPSTPDGLAQYSDLCCRLAGQLTARKTWNPVPRPRGAWYAADVDMALFAITSHWADAP